MAQQIKKKFIAPDAIDGSKLKLMEGEAVRLQTPAGEVELLKKDAQGKLVSEGEEISFKGDMEAHVESVRSSLQSNIDSEESRAMGVESSLQSQLSQEISDRQSEISRVEGLLSTEESARIAGDLNLQNQIDNVLSNIDPTALDSLTEIVAAFQEADGSLQGAISTLAGNSSGNISAEQSRAEAAEASLQAQITQEISDRQADVDAEETRAMGVESSLQSQITQEISDRQADVDAEQSRAEAAESNLANTKVSKSGDNMSGPLYLPMVGLLDNSANTGLNIGIGNVDWRGVGNHFLDYSNSLFVNSDLGGDFVFDNGISHVKVKKAPTESEDVVRKQELDAEQSRALAVEGSLQSQLTQEISDRQADVDTEESRAMGVEASLQSQITQEISDRIADVDVEESRAMAVEASLQSQISQEISDRQADVDAEQSRAEGIEASLQAQITQEISDRQFDVNAEQSRAEAAEASLQSQIDNVLSNIDPAALDSLTEIVAAFEAADSSLQGAISTLAGNSSSNIEAEESRAMAVEASLQAQITQEISDRQADVDEEMSRAMGVESSLQSQLNQEISDRISDVNAEESRALAAEGSLQSQITQEISDRQAAISSEESARIAEDLTFVKMDGSRHMTGGLTFNVGGNNSTAQLFEQDDTIALSFDDTVSQVYGGGVFNTDIYSGQIDVNYSTTGTTRLLGGFIDLVQPGTINTPKMPVNPCNVVVKKYVDDELNSEESRAMAVESSLQSQITQEISDRQADVDTEESRALAAEGLLDGRLDVLEALAFEKESFTLGVNPTGITLAHSPKAKSTVMFVGRLALHEGLDYSISGNQVTFIGDFAYDSEDEIAAAEGDVVKVTYYY